MSTDPNRSEEVIASYKQHKLARSALHRIQDLIHEFDRDDAFDRNMALVGLVSVVVLVAVSVFMLFSGNTITLG